MRDDRPTSKMEALDLRLLADSIKDRPAKPTGKMEKIDLLGLLWPTQEPEPIETAHVISRAPTPEVVQSEVFDTKPRPVLAVITTPPEMHERWQRWLRIRGSLALTVSLLTAVLVVLYLV